MIVAVAAPAQTRARSEKTSAEQPLHFKVNQGETNRRVKYLARAARYSIFLANNEADIVLHHEATPAGPVARGKVIVVHAYASVLRMRFADSNPPTSIVPLSGRSAIRDSSAGPYTAVAYRGIYPGMDIVFHGDQRKIGLDLVLSRGADPAGIVLEFDGATGIALDAAGNAVVRAGEASLVIERPSFLEDQDGRRRLVVGSFQIEPNNRLRFLVRLPNADDPVDTD